MTIADNVRRLLAEMPAGVRVQAAVKTRTPQEITEVLEAGISLLGENYVQEAESARAGVALPAEWHCIGHLQKNKVKKAVGLFDVIETVDSYALAKEIDRHCAGLGRIMPVYIEVNSGREPQKSGAMPEAVEGLVREIAGLEHIRVEGLMTMGPAGGGEACRVAFRETKRLFDRLRGIDLPGVELTELSMGMTDSYRVAIEEGSTMVRIGSLIFGPR